MAASDVAICNLALTHLGSAANVQSISPTDGSAESRWCATFYPFARNAMQELHPWGFATRRAQLSLIGERVVNQWAYAYGMPAAWLNALRVIDINASSEWTSPYPAAVDQCSPYWFGASMQTGTKVDQPFVVETTDQGIDILYTNQQNALLVYTVLVTDPTKFSPLFDTALSYLLASYLAGPIIKGSEGRAVARDMLNTAQAYLARATGSDAGDRMVDFVPPTAWAR